MSDSVNVNPRISFDPEDVPSITIPATTPEQIHLQDEAVSVETAPQEKPIPVPSEAGIAVPSDLPIETFNPDDQIQITMPSEMPIYTIKERLDDELSPGPITDSVLQQGEPLLNPLLPGADISGKVSYNGEPPRYLQEHLSKDFIRFQDDIFIRREPLLTAGDYHFVITDSEKAGRLGFIKANIGSRSSLIIDGATITNSLESPNYSATSGFGLVTEETISKLTIDQIYARRFIRSVWDECNRIRSTRGSLFAFASSPVCEVTTVGSDKGMAFFEPISFGVDDIIILRKIVEGIPRESFFQVKTIIPAEKRITATKLSGDDFDMLGCVAARVGNVTDAARAGHVVLSDDKENTPFLETRDGVQSVASYSDMTSIMARFGNLNGINDPILGNLSGFGIYARRLFGYGTVILSPESRFYYTQENYLTAQAIVNYFQQNDQNILSIINSIQSIVTALNDIPNNYYTKTQLQTSGQAQVHWDNISGKPTPEQLGAHTHAMKDVIGLPEDLQYIKDTYCTKQQSIIHSVIFSIALG